LDRDHHRQIAGDPDLVDAVKLAARAHQTAIWERSRHVLRLRSALSEYFPAAVEAFEDLSAKDTLILLGRAPSPTRAAKLTRSQVASALRAARWHHVEAKADALLAVLRAPGLRQPAATEAAYAAVVTGQVGIIAALNEQITQLEEVVDKHFGRHPAADIYLSQPGLGVVLAARVLGEFGDDKKRLHDVRARKNYSGQSPITRASGKKTIVIARYAANRRLGDALHQQAFSALSASHGARAYYDALRARKIGHHAALRQHPVHEMVDREHPHRVRATSGLSGGCMSQTADLPPTISTPPTSLSISTETEVRAVATRVGLRPGTNLSGIGCALTRADEWMSGPTGMLARRLSDVISDLGPNAPTSLTGVVGPGMGAADGPVEAEYRARALLAPGTASDLSQQLRRCCLWPTTRGRGGRRRCGTQHRPPGSRGGSTSHGARLACYFDRIAMGWLGRGLQWHKLSGVGYPADHSDNGRVDHQRGVTTLRTGVVKRLRSMR
jgi:hypothetical protein